MSSFKSTKLAITVKPVLRLTKPEIADRLAVMADTTFIITPSGDKYSMVSDDHFDGLNEANKIDGYGEDIHKEYDIKDVLDWLFNVKSFCAREDFYDEAVPIGCKSGVYETDYEIEEYGSYHSPVTDIGGKYNIYETNSREIKEEPTGAAGSMMQTNIFSPHKYTLRKADGVGPPDELTGEYLGDFFHHKGKWYASFEDSKYDMADRSVKKSSNNDTAYGLVLDKEEDIPFKNSSMTLNDEKPNWLPASGWPAMREPPYYLTSSKELFIVKKFFNDEGLDIEKIKNHCLCNVMTISFSGADSLESRIIDQNNDEAYGCSAGAPFIKCMGTLSYYGSTGYNDGIGIYYYDAGADWRSGGWTSSVNLILFANIDGGCYDTVDEEGYCTPRTPYDVTVTVEYRGKTKSKSYTTYEILNESNPAGIEIGSLTVYANPLDDESYFELM